MPTSARALRPPILCSAFSDADLAAIDREHVTGFLGSLQTLLVKEASERGGVIDDYACTLLGVVASPTHTLYFQIGDGAIVIPASDPEAYDWVFWPQHGEYANTTNFVTQANAQDVFELRVGPAVSEFAMFSDGLERLILNEPPAVFTHRHCGRSSTGSAQQRRQMPPNGRVH